MKNIIKIVLALSLGFLIAECLSQPIDLESQLGLKNELIVMGMGD